MIKWIVLNSDGTYAGAGEPCTTCQEVRDLVNAKEGRKACIINIMEEVTEDSNWLL